MPHSPREVHPPHGTGLHGARFAPSIKTWLCAVRDPPGKSDSLPDPHNLRHLDEDGQPRQFTWRTIQTWWFFYRKHGITESPRRADRGTIRKVSPELLATAIETVLPSFHGKPRNIAVVYRECIRRGLIRREQIAPNTSRKAPAGRLEVLRVAPLRTPPHESSVALTLATAVRKMRLSFSPHPHHDKSVGAPYPASLSGCKGAATLWW